MFTITPKGHGYFSTHGPSFQLFQAAPGMRKGKLQE